jgi:hypothetical protein
VSTAVADRARTLPEQVISEQVTQARDLVLLAVACGAGALVAPLLPYIGLPVAAAAAAGLMYRKRLVVAILAAVLGVAASEIIVPGSAVFAVPAVAAAIAAAWLLRHRSAQFVGLGLSIVVAASAVAADALSARLAGSTLVAGIEEQATVLTNSLKQALGAGASALSAQLATLRSIYVTLWPSFYVQTGVLIAVFVIAAIAWAAKKSGTDVQVPAAKKLDLSVHTLWPLVIGLVSLAAGQFLGVYTTALRALGFNALYVARALFFLQGVAVFSALFDVPKSGRGKMVALYATLWIFDQFLLIVSLVGLLDFWANFRRLHRDGAAEPAGLEEPPGSI